MSINFNSSEVFINAMNLDSFFAGRLSFSFTHRSNKLNLAFCRDFFQCFRGEKRRKLSMRLLKTQIETSAQDLIKLVAKLVLFLLSSLLS